MADEHHTVNEHHTMSEIVTHCPDCGQRLVRPPDFSASRLLYLHRKWGPCFPAGETLPATTSPEVPAG